MAIERRSFKRIRLDILPMIDVIFFLLVFFMLFTTFRTTPAGLNIELPKAVTAQKQQPTELTVNVAKDGSMYVDKEKVNGQRLRQLVKERLDKQPNLFVIIEADKQALYDYVVVAMDHVRASGGYKLGLAVQPQDG